MKKFEAIKSQKVYLYMSNVGLEHIQEENKKNEQKMKEEEEKRRKKRKNKMKMKKKIISQVGIFMEIQIFM